MDNDLLILWDYFVKMTDPFVCKYCKYFKIKRRGVNKGLCLIWERIIDDNDYCDDYEINEIDKIDINFNYNEGE
jgi:hypothetical protein